MSAIDQLIGEAGQEDPCRGVSTADARIHYYDLAQQRTRRLLAGCLIATFTGYGLVGGFWLQEMADGRSTGAALHLFLTALLATAGIGFLALKRVDERLYQSFIRAAVIDGVLQETKANGAQGAGLFLRDFPTRSSASPIVASLAHLASLALLAGAALHAFLAFRSADLEVFGFVVPVLLFGATAIFLWGDQLMGAANGGPTEGSGNRLPNLSPEQLLAYAVSGRYDALAVSALIGAPPARLTVVLSGGTHSGKSSVSRVLARFGATVIPEAAEEVLRYAELLDTTAKSKGANDESRAATRRRSLERARAFQAAVSELQAEQEAAAVELPGVVVLDRSMVDGLVFCDPLQNRWRSKAVSPPVPDVLQKHVEKAGASDTAYDLVFVLDTVTPFNQRSSTGRTTKDAEESRRAGTVLYSLYKGDAFLDHDPVRVLNPGGRVMRVPQLESVEARAEFIWREIFRHAMQAAGDSQKE